MLTLELPRADLEAIALAFAQEAARQHGVEVKSVALALEARSTRELSFRATVTAKAFIMSAEVVASGRLTIDDTLTARLGSLACEGHGPVASIAAAQIRPQFAALEGRAFPLADRTFAGLRLRDAAIVSADPLRLTAAIG